MLNSYFHPNLMFMGHEILMLNQTMVRLANSSISIFREPNFFITIYFYNLHRGDKKSDKLGDQSPAIRWRFIFVKTKSWQKLKINPFEKRKLLNVHTLLNLASNFTFIVNLQISPLFWKEMLVKLSSHTILTVLF